MVCILGIVEMLILAGGFTQDPRPTADSRPWTGKPLGVRVNISSLPMLVSLLVAGEVVDKAKAECGWAGRFECSKLSIRVNWSSISLSPASSLIPGSLYTHSALRSEHS